MPIKECSKGQKDGFQFGDSGTCYTHDGSDASKKAAKAKAVKQALAMNEGTAPKDLAARDLAASGIKTKTCSSCEKTRIVDKFPADGRTSDGLSSVCVGCRFSADRSMSEEDLETVNLDGVPILESGGPYYGSGSPEEGDFFDVAFLQELADAHTELATEIKVPIKIGHSKSQKLLKNSGLFSDEMPAAGWAENLRVSGEQLLADLRAVPKKLADLVKVGAFRTRSVELGPVTSQTQDGKEYDTVVTGLALLGAKAPAVRTLDDILAFYSEERDTAATVQLIYDEQNDPEVKRTVDFAAGDVVWESEKGSNDMRDDLSAAINQLSGPGYDSSEMESMSRYWVQDIDQVSKRAIVCDYSSNSYWVVGYNLDDGGEPVPAPFAEWTLAEQAWVESSQTSGENTQLSERRGDTKTMSATETKPFESLELSDEQVEQFAQGFGITEEDAGKRREQVMEKFAERTTVGETVETTAAATEESTETAAATTDAPTGLSEEQVQALAEKTFAQLANKDKIEGNIQVALRQGRILPANEKDWRKFYAEAPYELVTKQLVMLPVNPGLTRTYGSDESNTDPHREKAEAHFREFAAATGVPYREEAKDQ